MTPLRIVKRSEPRPVKQIIIVIYGPPGSGKTSLAFTAEAPLLYEFDINGGSRAAFRGDMVESITDWSQVTDVGEGQLEPYKTVVVDALGKMQNIMKKEIIKQNSRMGNPMGGLSQPGYGLLRAMFSTWMDTLKSYGKDIVLIVHMKEKEENDQIIERLAIEGATLDEVFQNSDIMGRVVLSRDGKQRSVDFTPKPNAFGKFPGRLQAVWPFPMPVEGQPSGQLLTNIIRDTKQVMGYLTEAQKKTTDEIEKWKLKIDGWKNTADFQLHIDLLQKAPETVKQYGRAKYLELEETENAAKRPQPATSGADSGAAQADRGNGSRPGPEVDEERRPDNPVALQPAVAPGGSDAGGPGANGQGPGAREGNGEPRKRTRRSRKGAGEAVRS